MLDILFHFFSHSYLCHFGSNQFTSALHRGILLLLMLLTMMQRSSLSSRSL
jgi:hypothetical protein